MSEFKEDFLYLIKKYDCSVVDDKVINKHGRNFKIEDAFLKFEESMKIMKEEYLSILEEQLQITSNVK
jgi:hypothetical protein